MAYFLVALVTLLGAPMAARAAFEVRGRFEPAQANTPIRIERELLEERIRRPVATTRVGADGSWSLRTDEGPGLFVLHVGDRSAPFVAADGDTLTAVLEGAAGVTLTGSRDHTLFRDYETMRTASLARHVLSVREAIARANQAADEASVARLTEDEVQGYIRHRRELNDFTLERLTGSAALYAASLRWDGDYRLADLRAQVDAYGRAQPGADIARRLQERIARFEAVALGAVAPELSGPTPDGGTLALSSLRRKYVLVDFWASWCAPCRLENRHYADLYAKYRSAGFEIFAVSVDQNGNGWKAAIAKDQASWLHVSDLTGWRTPLAAAYNVTALPASFLLDPEGRIIAKDARGPALAETLDKLFAAKR